MSIIGRRNMLRVVREAPPRDLSRLKPLMVWPYLKATVPGGEPRAAGQAKPATSWMYSFHKILPVLLDYSEADTNDPAAIPACASGGGVFCVSQKSLMDLVMSVSRLTSCGLTR